MQQELQELHQVQQLLLQLRELQELPREQVQQELLRLQEPLRLRVLLQLQLLRVTYRIHHKKLHHRDSLFRN